MSLGKKEVNKNKRVYILEEINGIDHVIAKRKLVNGENEIRWQKQSWEVDLRVPVFYDKGKLIYMVDMDGNQKLNCNNEYKKNFQGLSPAERDLIFYRKLVERSTRGPKEDHFKFQLINIGVGALIGISILIMVFYFIGVI